MKLLRALLVLPLMLAFAAPPAAADVLDLKYEQGCWINNTVTLVCAGAHARVDLPPGIHCGYSDADACLILEQAGSCFSLTGGVCSTTGYTEQDCQIPTAGSCSNDSITQKEAWDCPFAITLVVTTKAVPIGLPPAIQGDADSDSC